MADSLNEALGKISKVTNRNRSRGRTEQYQRRTMVCEDFDKEYSASGDGTNGTASIWLAVSPDLIYFERWELKIIIDPFVVHSVEGDGATTQITHKIEPADLTVTETLVPSTPHEHKHYISPNPHSHAITNSTHSHSINPGITSYPSELSQFEVMMDWIDLTPYFRTQYPDWITHDGMYPDTTVQHRYNILDAVNYMSDLERSKILAPGYHRLDFKADGLFTARIREFKKYSFIHRQGADGRGFY